jgi:hypothetical protein
MHEMTDALMLLRYAMFILLSCDLMHGCSPYCLWQAAMHNMTNELMLLGFATLILLAFQKDIDHICSEFPCTCS